MLAYLQCIVYRGFLFFKQTRVLILALAAIKHVNLCAAFPCCSTGIISLAVRRVVVCIYYYHHQHFLRPRQLSVSNWNSSFHSFEYK